MTAKLLSCPFCGGEAREMQGDPIELRWLYVRCLKCGASSKPSAYGERASASWNIRAPVPDLVSREAVIEEMKSWRDAENDSMKADTYWQGYKSGMNDAIVTVHTFGLS